jgi:hypothetical protein
MAVVDACARQFRTAQEPPKLSAPTGSGRELAPLPGWGGSSRQTVLTFRRGVSLRFVRRV